MMIFVRRVVFAGVLMIVVAPAKADTVDAVALVNAWYGALGPDVAETERIATISALVEPDARIELTDLGVTQTGTEFVESLPEWSDAIVGGRIAHRIEAGATATTVVATVCFRFDGNELLSRETFALGSKVTALVSETLSDSCAEF